MEIKSRRQKKNSDFTNKECDGMYNNILLNPNQGLRPALFINYGVHILSRDHYVRACRCENLHEDSMG